MGIMQASHGPVIERHVAITCIRRMRGRAWDGVVWSESGVSASVSVSALALAVVIALTRS